MMSRGGIGSNCSLYNCSLSRVWKLLVELDMVSLFQQRSRRPQLERAAAPRRHDARRPLRRVGSRRRGCAAYTLLAGQRPTPALHTRCRSRLVRFKDFLQIFGKIVEVAANILRFVCAGNC